MFSMEPHEKKKVLWRAEPKSKTHLYTIVIVHMCVNKQQLQKQTKHTHGIKLANIFILVLSR